MSSNTAVARREVMEVLRRDEAKERIAQLLPEGVNVERVLGAVSLALSDPKTGPALAQCTPESVLRAVARISQWGLEIGTTAHLVPFGGVCTPVADWKGLIELMIASGALRAAKPVVVWEGDDFDYAQGLEPRLVHVAAPVGQRGKLRGAYVVYTLPGNVRDFLYMPIEDIDAIRLAHSKQWKNGDCPPWYAQKTVVRQLSKIIPKNPRLARLMAPLADDEEPVSFPREVDPMPVHPALGAPSRAIPVEEYGTPEQLEEGERAMAEALRQPRASAAVVQDADDDEQVDCLTDEELAAARQPVRRRRDALAEG